MRRLIVTGSRAYTDRATFWQALDEQYEIEGSLIVAHGAWKDGADNLADDWLLARARGPQEYANVRPARFPPNFARYGYPAAFHIRNADMVKAGGDLCLAFFAPPPAGNRGTTNTVKLARDAGIPVREYGLENHATSDHRQETLPI